LIVSGFADRCVARLLAAAMESTRTPRSSQPGALRSTNPNTITKA